MTRRESKGGWNIIEGKIRQKWGKPTDDDLQFIAGKEEALIGLMPKRTGETRESVERTRTEDCCWSSKQAPSAEKSMLPNASLL